jgi:hypothetical protein
MEVGPSPEMGRSVSTDKNVGFRCYPIREGHGVFAIPKRFHFFYFVIPANGPLGEFGPS